MAGQSIESFNTPTEARLDQASLEMFKDVSFTEQNQGLKNDIGMKTAKNTVDKEFGEIKLFDSLEKNTSKTPEIKDFEKLEVTKIGDPAIHKSHENIRGIVDSDTVKAIRKNEQDDTGRSFVQRQKNNSWAERRLDKNGLSGDRTSVGPAQLQRKQLNELKEAYPHLRDVDHHTVEGADKFVAAYLDREAGRLNKGAYRDADDKSNPRHDEDPKIRKYFKNMQKHWDKAKKAGDQETMRKILIQSYNIGGGRGYLARVESQNSGKSVRKEDMPIFTQSPESK